MVQFGDPGPGGPGRERAKRPRRPELVEEPGRPPRRRRKRDVAGSMAKWTVRALAALVVLVVGLFLFLTRTDTGARLTLQEILQRLPINGSITVEDVRTRRLLEGATLYGIRVEGPDGRPFLAADSAELRYHWRTFIAGNVVFDRLHVWHPEVVVSRYPGEERFNVQELFVSDEEADTLQAGPPPLVLFLDTRIVDGNVRVLFPVEGEVPERAVTVPAPGGGGLLQRLRFQEVFADLPDVLLSSPDVQGQEVTVDSLFTVAEVFEGERVRLRHLRGTVDNHKGRTVVDADELVLEDTRARGTVFAEVPEEEGADLRYGFDLTSEEVHLKDLTWVEPRIPEGTARGGFALDVEGERQAWSFTDAVVNTARSRLRLSGDVTLRPERRPVFEGLAVEASPLVLAEVEPWIEGELPVEGSVSGDARLDGTPHRLRSRGRLTLRRPGPGARPITADFAGLLHLDDGVGFTDLEATVDPMDYGLLGELVEPLEIDGGGSVRVRATGHLDDGVRFTADLVHRPEGLPTSNIRARGSVREARGTWVVDVQADLSPLSLTAFRRGYPDLPVTGEVSGSVRASGPLTALDVRTDLDTEAGRLALDVSLNATDPGASYSVVGGVEDFRLSALVPALPDPTVVSGRIDIRGSGLEPRTARVTGSVYLDPGSRVGGLMIDTAAVALDVADGRVRFDTLRGTFGGIHLQGQGDLALAEGEPSGTVTLAFQSDSLGALQPYFFGDSLIVQEDLSALERDLLVVRGQNPDTLPTRDQVRVAGAVEGQVTLTGSLGDFAAEGQASFQRVAYGQNQIRDATVTFAGTELPGLDGRLQARVQADSLVLFDRRFSGADIEVDYRRPEGTLTALLERHQDEDYRARARFEVDTLGGRIEVEELALRFDTVAWELEGPSRVAWTDQGLQLDNLSIVRGGEDGLRVEAEGLIPREGPADFELVVENLELERLARLAQMDTIALEGSMDLELAIRGTASEPTIVGEVQIHDVVYQDFQLSMVESEVDYQGDLLTLDVEAFVDSLLVLRAQGTVPLEVSLAEPGVAFPDQAVDLDVVADSLPAAFVLAPVETLTEVEGTISGRFQVGGSVSDLSPEGQVVLNDAAWTMEDIGIRLTGTRGTLDLRPDGVVEVDAVARSGGTARVNGTVGLDSLTFDLDVALDEFRAVERRDVEGTVSGAVRLTQQFTRPFVSGNLVVDEGTLFLEELIRASTVVDLSDPQFFNVVDTTLFSARPIIEASQNPFMQNLRVAVEMEVRQDTWLRSDDMNVEIQGDLIVTYDRAAKDLVLVGDLEAMRGSYAVLGRTFEVEQGTVEFVGTPGINPNLDIQAVARVRSGDAPLEIVATVSGTLENPQVGLTSDEAALSQSDLISYLVFGRPSYALGAGEATFVQGAAGSLAGAAGSVLSGTVANQLSALLAQQWGFLDYFAITQVGDFGASSGAIGAGAFANTVVEVGWYWEEDLFMTLLFRPLVGLGPSSGSQFAGVQLEWQAASRWTVEAFWEERFLRGQSLGFQDLAFRTSKVFGFWAWWERGY